MRGDASTKRFTARTGLLSGFFVLAAGFAGVACDPFPPQDSNPNLANYKGRATVVWTLSGMPLTPEICQSERITSMNVFVASKQSRDDNVEFLNVTCGLDRYSMAMIPPGPVRVFVDAVRETTGKDPCVRYSGQIDVSAGSAFPSQATPVPLKLASSCK